MSSTNPTSNQETIKFRVPTSLKEDAVKLAQERNLSLSAFIRLMLTEYIKNKS